MPASPLAKPRGGSRPIAANDNRPRGGFKRRLLTIVTAAFLTGGAALHLVNIHVDSVVMGHTSRSAMVFGLVGLRRATHAAVEARDDTPDART